MKNPKITNLDRAGAKVAHAAFKAAIDAVALELGLTVKMAGGTYDPDGGRAIFKFQVLCPNPDTGEIETSEARAFKLNAHCYGLMPDMLGRTIDIHGMTVKIIGLQLRARRYPVLATNQQDGRTIKLSAAACRLAVGL